MIKTIKNEKSLNFSKLIACAAVIAAAGSGSLAAFAKLGMVHPAPSFYMLLSAPFAILLVSAGVSVFLMSMDDDMALDAAGLSESDGAVLAQRRYAKLETGRNTKIIAGAPFVAYNDVRNTMVLMSEDTGKTQSVFLPTAFSWKGSLIAYDEYGELWRKTAERRASFSKTILVDISSSDCARYNYIDDLPRESMENGTKTFFLPFFQPCGNGSFKKEAFDFLCAFVLFALMARKLYPNSDRNIPALLADLRRTHNSGEISSLLVNMKNTRNFMDDYDPRHDDGTLAFITRTADNMEKNGGAFRENIIDVAFSSVAPLESQAGAEFACRSQFSLEDMYSKDEPLSIYLCFNEAEIRDDRAALCSALLGFFAWRVTECGKKPRSKILFSLENIADLRGKPQALIDSIPKMNASSAGVLYGSKACSRELNNWGAMFKEKILPCFRTWVFSCAQTAADKEAAGEDIAAAFAELESTGARQNGTCYVADKPSEILYAAKLNCFNSDRRFSAKGKGVKRWS